ncbi:MAG: hypothetical protein EPO20_24040 [Betaproteobacteria bacterium]|nr:MAG: hypothetical protein EPO20_24040 [Betaproteobacteria bacterium]
MNRCPVCAAKIPEYKLMCWPHWRLVPELLQDQVLGTWKTMLRGANPSIRRLAREEYRKARDAAIAAVRERATEDTQAGL